MRIRFDFGSLTLDAELLDTPSAKAIAERQQAWSADIPKDEAAVWDWLAALHDDSRAALDRRFRAQGFQGSSVDMDWAEPVACRANGIR